MKSLRFLLTLLCFIAIAIPAVLVGQEPTVSIVPQPVRIQYKSGHFTFPQKITVGGDQRYAAQLQYLQQTLASQIGSEIALNQSSPTIEIIHQTGMPHAEQYELTVTDKRIIVAASDLRGVVNGIQTVLQLFPLSGQSIRTIPQLQISDYPRFSYRGMHLDVVRHMFPLSYIKKYIEYLSFHKFNTFHWHLTDDQGWRIEMLSYPKLNSIGSWRDSTLIGHFRDTPARYEYQRYGGYYTREEVKEVLAFAAVRGITVIPEIDIPGHSRATITAYPELSTEPQNAWGVAATWGMYNRQNNVLAPSDASFQFLRTVFHEIADLFPSTYIHLGGDECSKMWWKKSESTQAFMKAKGIKDEVALQTYFVDQVAGYLKEKGKKVIGWHEIMEGKPDTSTIVMNWANDEKALEAAQKGFKIIMTPGKPYYFDHYQSKDPADSLAIHGYNPLEAVYRYEPLPERLIQKGFEKQVLGGQANVWTEYMGSPTKVDYMIFPRMSAVSESLWTPAGQKNYADFLLRLEKTVIPRYRYWNSSWFTQYRTWTMKQP